RKITEGKSMTEKLHANLSRSRNAAEAGRPVASTSATIRGVHVAVARQRPEAGATSGDQAHLGPDERLPLRWLNAGEEVACIALTETAQERNNKIATETHRWARSRSIASAAE